MKKLKLIKQGCYRLCFFCAWTFFGVFNIIKLIWGYWLYFLYLNCSGWLFILLFFFGLGEMISRSYGQKIPIFLNLNILVLSLRCLVDANFVCTLKEMVFHSHHGTHYGLWLVREFLPILSCFSGVSQFDRAPCNSPVSDAYIMVNR